MRRPMRASPSTRVSSVFSASVTMRVASRSPILTRPRSVWHRLRHEESPGGTMTDSAVRLSHVAIAVSDLPTSIRFYAEGLGFELGPCFDAGDEVAAVSEVDPPVRMTSQYLTKDGVRLELMGWEAPVVHGEASATRNHRGLTHLSFEVDDIVETEARLLAVG